VKGIRLAFALLEGHWGWIIDLWLLTMIVGLFTGLMIQREQLANTRETVDRLSDHVVTLQRTAIILTQREIMRDLDGVDGTRFAPRDRCGSLDSLFHVLANIRPRTIKDEYGDLHELWRKAGELIDKDSENAKRTQEILKKLGQVERAADVKMPRSAKEEKP
jgi:hypothetical protein